MKLGKYVLATLPLLVACPINKIVEKNDIDHMIGAYSGVCTSGTIETTDILTDKRLSRGYFQSYEDIDRDGRADFKYLWMPEKITGIEAVVDVIPVCSFSVTPEMRIYPRGSADALRIESEMTALRNAFEAPPTPEKRNGIEEKARPSE
jgi:hypothetical protein